MPPIHLQPVATGAGLLRRVHCRPYRHALQTDARLLQSEPGDGIHPRRGRCRWGERQLRRVPHPHTDHRKGLNGAGRVLCGQAGPADPEGAMGATRRGPELRRRTTRCGRGGPRPDPQGSADLPRPGLHRDLPGPQGRAEDPHLSPRTTPTPTTSSRSSGRNSAKATTSARRSPIEPPA